MSLLPLIASSYLMDGLHLQHEETNVRWETPTTGALEMPGLKVAAGGRINFVHRGSGHNVVLASNRESFDDCNSFSASWDTAVEKVSACVMRTAMPVLIALMGMVRLLTKELLGGSYWSPQDCQLCHGGAMMSLKMQQAKSCYSFAHLTATHKE